MDKTLAAMSRRDKQTLWVENSGHVITREADPLVMYRACWEPIRRVRQEDL